MSELSSIAILVVLFAQSATGSEPPGLGKHMVFETWRCSQPEICELEESQSYGESFPNYLEPGAIESTPEFREPILRDPHDEWTKSEFIISSDGNAVGYGLTAVATTDELNEFSRRRASQLAAQFLEGPRGHEVPIQGYLYIRYIAEWAEGDIK